MVSMLVSGMSCLGSCPGWGHCVVSLRKTFDSHRASPHPGVQISTSELNAGGNPVVDWHPIQGGVEILLVTSYYRDWDKLWPDRPLGSYSQLYLVWLHDL